MITTATGNLLTNDAEALVNTVNLDGVMGKGIALQFAKAFPEILPPYEAACRSGALAPGRVQVIERPGLVNPRYIINVPTKRRWRGKSRMADIDTGLADLVRVIRERGIRSIAVPPLGCGLGGLAWDDVRQRIESAFAAVPEVDVRLFAPAGAPAPADQPNRTAAPALTAARARVIQVLGAYLDLGYELSLLEVQKLLYFLQGAGDDLKLAYGKNRYGPYADNLRHVLKRFEGHYTQGYGDGNDAPDTEITLLPEARDKAQAYLAAQAGDGDDAARLTRVVELIEGFESPYGLELLATVHWVAANEGATTLDAAVAAVHAWSDSKQQRMSREHIALAWERLQAQGWLPEPPRPAAVPATSAARTAGKYDALDREALVRLLERRDAERQLGLVWERDELEADRADHRDYVALGLDEALSHGEGPWPNLIIEGDNLDALRALRMSHAGRIRCIYIDPPYNTGNRDFVYNDRFVDKTHRFRHSLWLEFMHKRLLLARDLLTPDGVLLVSINDENRAKLELLLDGVMPGRRLGSLAWRTKDTGNDLSQRFSHVHEHVLVYANAGFRFNGRPIDRSKFRNPDNDPRGEWSPQPITKAHTYIDRENTYYPIQDPATGLWYPCDPERVWAYASEQEIRRRLGDDEAAVAAALAGLRSSTMEQLIAEQMIYFPPCRPDEVMRFDTREALLAAILAKAGPKLPKKKTPLLREDLPDLDFWVGKPIAPGRPSRKEHWTARPESERLAPLSSWIAGVNETVDDEDDTLVDAAMFLRSVRGGVATDEIKDLLGSKVFSHPKPLSLIEGLMQQATRADDIVLDFFAGSGTTAHAVAKLNAEDGGNRRFILVSSTEATDDQPGKNLCRDVCAERVRRVLGGYTNAKGEAVAGLGGGFAYLKARRVAPHRLSTRLHHAEIWSALQLLHDLPLSPWSGRGVAAAADARSAVAYLPEVDVGAEAAVRAWRETNAERALTLYSWTPERVRAWAPGAQVAPIPESLRLRFGR